MPDFKAKFRLDIPCVVQDPYELGIQAGDILFRKLHRKAERSAPQHICLPATLQLPAR